MSRFLLDTDVISMLSPSRAAILPGFLQWLDRADSESRVFLCAISVHEIKKEIVLLEQKAASAKAAALSAWLTGLQTVYADKILSLDAEAAAFSGELEAMALARGADPGMADAAVAGIARAHGMTIVSRSSRHFQPFGVAVVTPEEAAREC